MIFMNISGIIRNYACIMYQRVFKHLKLKFVNLNDLI